ncbi:DUF3890 domain-containing protein (plasmid) [Borrelia hermsii]|uniref:BBP06-like protein n=3 Tax=Borrelia hermsii TaxID=140 RepID=Q6YI79_BORHE|nr:DUF3890 domain-containing protein [Borrelia hermsii]AAN61056.1 BBP06-like protein [Borrelia hermsii]UPA08234.1 DUF3890 domain-containing protein [Borrelia hermsii DAH]
MSTSNVPSGGFGELYLQIKALLDLSEEKFSFAKFEEQAKLLEMIIETRGINPSKLNISQASLLLYYYIGCHLKRSGVIREFGLEQIKKEKFGELEIDYYPSSGTELNCGSKDYCSSFEELITQIKSGARKTYCIGVV